MLYKRNTGSCTWVGFEESNLASQAGQCRAGVYHSPPLQKKTVRLRESKATNNDRLFISAVLWVGASALLICPHLFRSSSPSSKCGVQRSGPIQTESLQLCQLQKQDAGAVSMRSSLSFAALLQEARWNSVGGGNNLEEADAHKTRALPLSCHSLKLIRIWCLLQASVGSDKTIWLVIHQTNGQIDCYCPSLLV